MTQSPSMLELAEKLSEAQRKAVLSCEPKGRNLVTGEPCSFRAYAAREQTADVLVRLGLSSYERSGRGYRIIALTPLGLEVAAALRAHTQGAKP